MQKTIDTALPLLGSLNLPFHGWLTMLDDIFLCFWMAFALVDLAMEDLRRFWKYCKQLYGLHMSDIGFAIFSPILGT